MRYWYIDSCNLVTMMLLDKSYYDYDFEKVEKPTPVIPWEETIKTDEEVNDILAIFGLGKKAQTDEEKFQEFIMKEEQ